MFIRQMSVIFGASLAVMTAFSGPAHAQTVEELQRQIDELKAMVQTLKAQQERKPDTGTVARETPPLEPLKVEATGAPRFSGDGFSKFKINGRILADLGFVGRPNRIGTVENGVFTGDPGLGTTSEIRSIRLGVEGEVSDWAYKFVGDFFDNKVTASDMTVQYRGFQHLTLTAGNQKTAVSMEEHTLLPSTTFMERAMFTDAFGFSHKLGVSAKFSGDNWSWKAGAYAGGGLTGDDEQSGYILSSRAHYVIPTEQGFVHLGGAVEYRDNGEQPNRLRNRPTLHTTDTQFIDTGVLDTNSSVFFGAEFASNMGPFNVAAEFGTMDIDLAKQAGRDNSARLDGAYVHMTYFLTGEQRGYDASDGKWVLTSPLTPLGQGGYGALSFSLGFDWVNLNDGGAAIEGGEQTTYLAGVTWIPIRYVRFLANLSHVEVNDSRTHVRLRDNGQLTSSFGLNTFGLRAQVSW